jgi:crotonobetainyl-CoA:carnitine CoA-transferase CaiB-like acyl-CoA transferase
MLLDCTVLEIADHSGQMAGRLLRELGARVIKVEPLDGDPVRWTPPLRVDATGLGLDSMTYRHLNSGKLTIAFDLTTDGGRRILRELVSRVDIIVTTCGRDALASLHLSESDLRDLNDRVVHVSLTSFGLNGPKSEWRATDAVAFASGGLLSIAGDANARPCLPPETQAYYFASYAAVLAATAGLYCEHSEPIVIDVSIQETLASQEHQLPLWLNRSQTIQRSGSQHRSVAPASIFPTRDGFVYLFVSRIHWKSFLGAWPNHPTWLDSLVEFFRSATTATTSFTLAHRRAPNGQVLEVEVVADVDHGRVRLQLGLRVLLGVVEQRLQVQHLCHLPESCADLHDWRRRPAVAEDLGLDRLDRVLARVEGGYRRGPKRVRSVTKSCTRRDPDGTPGIFGGLDKKKGRLRTGPDLRFLLSGRRDSNPRPPPWQLSGGCLIRLRRSQESP